jgi:SAM-dependent methyltransferase
MDLGGWDDRYRAEAWAPGSSTPLLVDIVRGLSPGSALDMASGTGRNALWLAGRGWRVTAVDGSSSAIETLRSRATELGLEIDVHAADLENGGYRIEPGRWDLIALCYYLQRDLFESVKSGVVRGGVVVAIVHTTEPGEEPTKHRLRPGELREYFHGWEILHDYEGRPHDPPHQRLVSEIVARRS